MAPRTTNRRPSPAVFYCRRTDTMYFTLTHQIIAKQHKNGAFKNQEKKAD